mgnify:CR=1 FL=1
MEPLVGIIIGSDSDLGVMSKTAEILDKLEIPYEFSIISAHRTPDRMYEYARQARKMRFKTQSLQEPAEQLMFQAWLPL